MFKKYFLVESGISITTLLALVLSAGILVSNFTAYYKDNKFKTNKDIEFQKEKIEYTIFQLESLLMPKTEKIALDFIGTARTIKYFDFYEIKKNSERIAHSSNYKISEDFNFPENLKHFEVRLSDLNYYVTTKKIGLYYITLGYFPSNHKIFTFDSVRYLLIESIFWIVLFVFAFIFFVFKDILNQFKFMRLGQVQKFKTFKSLTREGKQLNNLYELAISNNIKDIRDEIPDAIEKELSSGAKENDRFLGSLFRIDLNSYTSFSTKYGNSVIDELLKSILIEFKDIAQRYKHFEILDEGDGRGYFYRSNDKIYASKLAVSSIRGMYEISHKYSKIIQSKIGENFSFKSGVSFDEARISKEEQKFKIRGSCFYNSARTIGIFKDEQLKKKKVYFVSAIKKYFGIPNNLVNSTETIFINLDGIGNEELILFNQFKLEPETIEDLEFFLSNNDLKISLFRLINKFDINFFWGFQKSIIDLKIYVYDKDHADQLFSLLNIYDSIKVQDEVIAATLMMFIKFVEPGYLEQEKIQILSKYLKTKNSRIISNAMEVLNYLDVFTDEASEFLSHENNRVRANAQVIVGKHQLSNDLSNSIMSLLEVANTENFILSGIYSLDKIFSYYLNRNYTIFKTADFFKYFISQVGNLKNIENQKIKERVDNFISKYEIYFN